MDLAMRDDDMLTEILLRLPAKSLTKFKSVCKRWRIIVSSPYFRRIHTLHTLRRAKLQPSLILQIKFRLYLSQTINGAKTVIPYEKGRNLPSYKIVQACNGLMLLESKHKYMRESGFDFCDPTTAESLRTLVKDAHAYYHHVDDWYIRHPTTGERIHIMDDNYYDDRYYVYNPTTRQSREIDMSEIDDMSVTPQRQKYPRVVAMGLAFDPSKSPYYKVVCIRSTLPRDSYPGYQVEVYDSESHSWKVSLEVVTSSTTSFDSAEYWNNSIYFMSNGEGYCIYDIDKNEMTAMLPFPQTPDDIGIVDYDDQRLLKRFASFCFQESNGHLYLMKSVLERKSEAKSVVVWKWGGNDDSQWLYKYHHRYDGMKINIVRLLVGPDGDKTCSLLTNKTGKIGAFDIINKTYEDLFVLDTKQGFVSGFQFAESLALV